MIENLLRSLARSLDQEKISYMVIGGQAVLLYGSPRLTRDIDITLGIDTDRFSSVEKICKKLRLKMLPRNPQRFASETKVLPTEDRRIKIRVDFIFSFTPYERQAMARTRKVRLEGYPVKFASPEDVLIHKIFAGRPVDEDDVRGILFRHRTRIETRYIRKWLREFEKSSGRKLLRDFNRLLRQVKR